MAFKNRSVGILLTCGLTLAGCEMTSHQASFNDFDMKPPLASLNAKRKIPSSMVHAFQLLQEEKYTEASSFINQELQSHPKSVVFHILNGMTYEKLAERGDPTGNELAAVGYQNAVNLDQSNVFALAQLGKLKYREQEYAQAQEHFANALLKKPNDPELLHELAAASYYAYDIKTAVSAIDKAEKLKPEDPLVHRSAAMIHAAIGDFDTAQKHLTVFKKKAGDDPAVAYVAARFNDWETLYKSGRITLAAANPEPVTKKFELQKEEQKGGSQGGGQEAPKNQQQENAPNEGGGEGAQSPSLPPSPSEESQATTVTGMPIAPEGANQPFAPPGSGMPTTPAEEASNYGPQIIIDCYLLRITETAQTSKGNNILENLAVTLSPGGITKFKGYFAGSGVSPLGSPGISSVDNAVINPATGFRPNQLPAVSNGTTSSVAPTFANSTTALTLANKGSISGQVFAAGITWAGLTYSLNIANASDTRTEVISRPSLMTFLKKPSTFFSGDELSLGLAGQYGGSLIKYPVGITLEVTPDQLIGEDLYLQVGVEGSLIISPNPNLNLTVDAGVTRVDTYVKVRLGETLMLGGIYERFQVLSNSGVPGLQDIPIVQYFFSNESTRSDRRSIVFMLTPRSPDAVKSAVNRAMTREAVGHNVSELIVRNPDWFNTNPNLVKIFRYLTQDPIIYYEFRSADVLPPSWGWEMPLKEKLTQISSFAYY